MQYFILKNDFEPKNVGVKDGMGQISTICMCQNQNNSWYEKMFGFANKRTHEEWAIVNKHIHYAQRPLVDLVLRKGGILTDYMTFDLGRCLVSNKLKKILERFNLPNCNFLPMQLCHENTNVVVQGYWWFAFDKDLGIETIDYMVSKYKEDVEVESYWDYQALGIRFTKIVLNNKFDLSLDFWACPEAGNRPFISERLIEAMRSENITGCIYSENRETLAGFCVVVFP
jgi:hypothetical protein